MKEKTQIRPSCLYLYYLLSHPSTVGSHILLIFRLSPSSSLLLWLVERASARRRIPDFRGWETETAKGEEG